MTGIKSKKARFFLPVIVLTPSFYYSASFTSGIIIGYFASKLFYNNFVKSGKINCIWVDLGKWKIHLHHWIMGAVVLLIVWTIDYFYLPTLFTGAVVGVIIHDIYDFDDWYKVVLRNSNK